MFAWINTHLFVYMFARSVSDFGLRSVHFFCWTYISYPYIHNDINVRGGIHAFIICLYVRTLGLGLRSVYFFCWAYISYTYIQNHVNVHVE